MAEGRIRRVLIGLLIACVLGSVLLPSLAAGATDEVSLPGVVDMKLTDALKTLKKSGLKVSHHDAVKNRQRSRWVKSNWVVISQEPQAGSTVPGGSNVRLGLRHKNDMSWPGQPPVPVPSVVGMRLDKAKKTLKKAFLQAESFDGVRSEDPRKQKNNKNWTVISQDPTGGATTAGGSKLRLGVRHKEDSIEAPPPPTSSPPPTSTREPTEAPLAPLAGLPVGDDTTVSRVIDGDTIEVAGGTRIRFIGIDTPETSGRAGCFGTEATGHTSELLPAGTKVRLVYDVDRTDRYGRTLAYLYRASDSLFVNLALAQAGFALQLTVPPNVAHAEEFREAVAEARAAGRGLWTACQGAAAAPAVTTATARPSVVQPVTPASTTPSGGCHTSYRGACVPVAEDVDCAGGSGNGPAYVADKDIQVVGPDEYGLDSDSDGVACESRR